MPAPTRRRFINIKNFKHTVDPGGTPVVTEINTIKSVEVGESTNIIRDAADDDTFDSFMATGMRRIDGSVDIGDPVQRLAAVELATGTTEFEGQPEDGGDVYKVTITNNKFHSQRLRASHSSSNQPWGGNMSMAAYAPDGQTNPLTIAEVVVGP